MTKIYYTTEHQLELSNEQMQQIVDSLRENKICGYTYTKECNEFYLGHVVAKARDLGIAGIPPNFRVTDSTMLIVEKIGDTVEYNLYD